MAQRGPGPCGRCGSADVVRILYGLPEPEALERARREEIELGGCLASEGAPERRCRACGATWSRSAGWTERRGHGGSGETPDEA